MNAILQFFGTILSFFSDLTGGFYLFGLFLFALLIKIILVPFAIKQQKTTIKQAKMRPKEMAIRNKYKGRTDRVTQQKMQNEVMDLYQREGYSPMSGCLPLLIQMPVLIILYNVIINPLNYICGWTDEQIIAIGNGLGLEKVSEFASRDIELIQHLTPANQPIALEALAKAGLEAVDFSSVPNFTMGIFDLSGTPSFTSILILVPILTFVFQFLASKITRKFTYQPMSDDAQTQKSMKMMDIMLPLMTTWIAFSVPAAIGIYWMFNNILGVLQTIIIQKAMPVPHFTEEDVKAAARELAGKAPKNVPAAETAAKPVRSLHTIDFSDEEVEQDLGEYTSVYDKTPEEREAANEKPEEISEGKKKLFGKSKMKDE